MINGIGNFIGQSQVGAAYAPSVRSWLSQGVADGGTPPSPTILNALSAFMTSLDTAGIGPSGSRMKTGNIMHSGSKEFVKLNLKDVATYKWTEVGTVDFSEGNGCRSASSSYFHHAFKSNEYAGIESNLTSIQYISESNATGSSSQTSQGFRTSSTLSLFFATNPKFDGTNGQIYHFSGATNFLSANHKALIVNTFTGGNNVIYRDGVKTTAAVTPTAPTTACNRMVLAYNSSTASTISPLNFYPKYIAIDFLYDAFSDADELAFRTAFNTYKTAVSLP